MHNEISRETKFVVDIKVISDGKTTWLPIFSSKNRVESQRYLDKITNPDSTYRLVETETVTRKDTIRSIGSGIKNLDSPYDDCGVEVAKPIGGMSRAIHNTAGCCNTAPPAKRVD